MPDNVEVRKELEQKQAMLDECVLKCEELVSSIASIDEKLKSLATERESLCSELDAVGKKRVKYESDIRKLQDSIIPEFDPDTFRETLMELVTDFLESKTLSELKAIDSTLASYKPVAGRKKVNTGVDSAPDSTAKSVRIESISLADMSEAGLAIKAKFGLMQFAKAFIKFGDVRYELDMDVLFPEIDGKKVCSFIEYIRNVYTLGFFAYLQSKGVKTASELMDYYIGYEYINTNGMLAKAHRSSGSLNPCRIVNKSGEVVKEVSGFSNSVKIYTLYTDAEGNRLETSVTGNVTADGVVRRMFNVYFGVDRQRKYIMPACRDIDFREIFADAVLEFGG